MIDLHYWPTPNGHKITLFLEEAGLDYRILPLNIGKGAQFEPDYLRISPNNKMPAIVDHAPDDGGAPISVFESGAILEYLADKTGRFIPADLRGRTETLQWLYWQMGGLGPMTGQYGHFNVYAPERIDYAIDRYTREVQRLLGVLDRQLAGRDFVAGEYSIADMAIWPWAKGWEGQQQRLEDFPNMAAWLERVGARPAVQKGAALAEEVRKDLQTDREAQKILFGKRDD